MRQFSDWLNQNAIGFFSTFLAGVESVADPRDCHDLLVWVSKVAVLPQSDLEYASRMG
jgi:hypothetical protein